jgi:hypothetical protein
MAEGTRHADSLYPEHLQRSQRIDMLLASMLDACGLESGLAPASLDALTIHDVESGCLFAPAEVSLSFSAHRPPAVRCLAEIVNSCSPEFPERVVSTLGDRMMAALSREGGKYDEALFHDCANIVYPGHRAGDRPLRFGAAIEWQRDASIKLKHYFDLHAEPRELAAHRMEAVFDRLDLLRQLGQAKTLLGSRIEDGRCRGIAVDCGRANHRGLRLYMPGICWSLRELRDIVNGTGRQELMPLLDLFNCSVLGRARTGDAINHLLVSFVFTSESGNNPIIKLDAFMPGLKPDDLASYEAFCTLAEALGIPRDQYDCAFRALNEAHELSNHQAILQYLSLDLIAPYEVVLNAYFRVPGAETAHMGPRVRPRRKKELQRAIDASCRMAVQVLERERPSHYSEAVHRMMFPRAAGFTAAEELHLGEAFQNTIIIDALLDAEKAGYGVDRRGIDNDVSRLVEMRSSTGVRGWKYFPLLPELPPDCDDLAQVMQVLIRVEFPAMSDIIDPLLKLIDEGNPNPDGSIETWIVDTHNHGTEAAVLNRFIRDCWGTGPDPEVVANLLYALSIYDPQAWKMRIRRGIEYLVSCQLADGSWPAAWYAGSAYSTFVCARAVMAAEPSHYSLYCATQFLVDRQHASGGWGEGAPNCGDTAYALRAACLLRNEMARCVIEPACRFLLDQQQRDGFWPASDFIVMDTSRARDSRGGIRLHYRSRTVTTAACLSSLCAARRLIDAEE